MPKQSGDDRLLMELRQFNGGVNTRDFRTAIKDNEFSWLENVMPIADGNLQVIPGPGTAEATIPAPPTTITYMKFAVINSQSYIFAATADGRLYSFNTTTNTLTQINGAFTFNNPYIAQWKQAGVVIIDPVAGYFDYNITTPNTLTQVSASITGVVLEVYSGRVWIATGTDGRTVQYTDVNSYNSFAGAGGSFIITEGNLQQTIFGMAVTNNYLYIFGDNSVRIVGDVAVSSGITTLSVVTLTTSVGTEWPTAVAIYERTVSFVDTHGVYGMMGSSPQRLSMALDGIYPDISFSPTGGLRPVAAVTMLFNILCLFVLFPQVNVNGTVKSLVCTFFDGKWFFITYPQTINYITYAKDTGTDVLYAASGNTIFHLTGSTTTALPITIQTKLYPLNGAVYSKQMEYFGLEVNTTAIANLTVSIDSLNSVAPLNNFTMQNDVVWLNGSNQIVSWVNNLSQPVTWISAGPNIYFASAQGGGKYLGFTISGTVPNLTVSGIFGEYTIMEPW